MIYFIQRRSGGPIKIGTTVQLTQRLRQLCNDVGDNLRVLAITDGGRDEEKIFHDRFAHLRIGDSILSEWFEPGDDLVGFVLSEGRCWDGIDEDGRVTVINLKGTPEYRNWLSSMSKKTRIPASSITRIAYEEWAKKHGHPAPPEL